MEAKEFQSAHHMARHLARYISSASTIRSRVREHFDQDIPSLDAIEKLRAKPGKPMAYNAEEPTDADAAVFQVGSLLRPVKPKNTAKPKALPWPRWYNPIPSAKPSNGEVVWPSNGRLTFDVLVFAVASSFGVMPGEVKGKRRHRNLTHARAVIIRILCDRGLSYPTIGRLLGDRDHSTIINARNKFTIYERLDDRVTTTYLQFRDRQV